MSAPRLEINLDRLHHNARTLVTLLGRRGISVTGVTKATLGSPTIAREFVRAGVASLGDSRIENLERQRGDGIDAPMMLIRSPMPSQCSTVVAVADLSLNSELEVIRGLSAAAGEQRRTHGVVLMVELGDLREGILPGDLHDVARETLQLANITLRGIGTNLACQSGVAPDAHNMGELSVLASRLESDLGVSLDIVSGGNSANLDWALGADSIGRINHLRLGESILLGREPLRRTPIDNLFTDAFTLVAEVIEAKVKPTHPWGEIYETAFGVAASHAAPSSAHRVLIALGQQDTDPAGLAPPAGFEIIGSSSDHVVLAAERAGTPVGSELRFAVNYAALLRAATSPFVECMFSRDLAAQDET